MPLDYGRRSHRRFATPDPFRTTEPFQGTEPSERQGSLNRHPKTFFEWPSNLFTFFPFSFTDEALERTFTNAQLAHGLSLGTANLAAACSVTVLSIIVASHASDLDLKFAYCILGLSLMGFFLFYKYPAITIAHIQVIHGIVRLGIQSLGIFMQPLLMRQRSDQPLSFIIFVQTYALHTFVIPNTVLKVGAWQAFFPNLVTSTMLLLIQASTNRKYCFALGPASVLDVGPMSGIPTALDVLSASIFAPGLTPWHLEAAPSCSRNIAAFQLLSSFLVDVGLLICEIVQRRAFLKKHVGIFGPGGGALAASWPLGNAHGVQKSIMLAMSYLAVLSFAWQVILINFV